MIGHTKRTSILDRLDLMGKGDEEELVEGKIYIDQCFSDDGAIAELKEAQFSTTYI